MKDIGYYPSGAINQHKALATGAALPKADTRNLDPNGGSRAGGAVQGTVHKSGTSTGDSRNRA